MSASVIDGPRRHGDYSAPARAAAGRCHGVSWRVKKSSGGNGHNRPSRRMGSCRKKEHGVFQPQEFHRRQTTFAAMATCALVRVGLRPVRRARRVLRAAQRHRAATQETGVRTRNPGPPARRVAKLYRLRWQVELVFKRMKSLMNYGQLPKHDATSCRAWLYGKLLLALLVERLIQQAKSFSPWGYALSYHAESLEGGGLHASWVAGVPHPLYRTAPDREELARHQPPARGSARRRAAGWSDDRHQHVGGVGARELFQVLPLHGGRLARLAHAEALEHGEELLGDAHPGEVGPGGV